MNDIPGNGPAGDVRPSAGRAGASEAMPACALFAGAHTIFFGAKLLTTGNPPEAQERELPGRPGIVAMPAPAAAAG